MASFVFLIVAITMIAMAKGGFMGVCKEWAEEIGKCSKGNEAEACCREQGIPDLCFGYCVRKQPAKQRQMPCWMQVSNCEDWMDEMAECREGHYLDSVACCKKKCVPSICFGGCREEGGMCEAWTKQVHECN